MPEPAQYPTDYIAEVRKMTDEELTDTWATASNVELTDPSALAKTVADEMAQRCIST